MTNTYPNCPQHGTPPRAVILVKARVRCELNQDGSIGRVLSTSREKPTPVAFECGGGHEYPATPTEDASLVDILGRLITRIDEAYPDGVGHPLAHGFRVLRQQAREMQERTDESALLFQALDQPLEEFKKTLDKFWREYQQKA